MPLIVSQQQIPLYPVIVATVVLSGQTAAIASTPILANAPPGIYRANVSLVLTAVGTSGNLIANVIATDDAQAETIVAATITSILAKGQAGSSVIIQNTATGNINYSTTFSLVIGAAAYSLYIVLERLF